MVAEQSTLMICGWQSLKTEQKWTQIETMEEHIRRAGALESDVPNQGSETGDASSTLINRVEPEATDIQRVAPEVTPKTRPPPPPETGSSGNVEERPTSANQAEYSTEPGAGRTNASNGNPNVGRQR